MKYLTLDGSNIQIEEIENVNQFKIETQKRVFEFRDEFAHGLIKFNEEKNSLDFHKYGEHEMTVTWSPENPNKNLEFFIEDKKQELKNSYDDYLATGKITKLDTKIVASGDYFNESIEEK